MPTVMQHRGLVGQRWVDGLLVGVALSVVGGCAGDPAAITGTSSTDEGRSNAAAALSPSRPLVEDQVRTLGCAVLVPTVGGGTHVARVPAAALPWRKITAAEWAATRTVSTGIDLAHVVRTGRTLNDRQSIEIACVVPTSVSHGALTAAIAEAPALAMQGLVRHVVASGQRSSPAAPVDLSGVLLAPLHRSMARREYGSGPLVSSPQGGGREASLFAARAFPTGTWPSPGVAPHGRSAHRSLTSSTETVSTSRPLVTTLPDVQPLPTITITATPTSWIVDMTSYWAAIARNRWVLSSNLVIHADAAQCAHVQAWIHATEPSVWALQEDLNKAEAATNAVANNICVLRGVTGALCIDLFIRARFAGPLKGDARDHDPNAPYAASRAQIYLTPNNLGRLTGWVVVSGTHVRNAFALTPGVEAGFPADAIHQVKRALITHLSPTRVRVEYALWNSMCTAVQAPICPTILGDHIFERDSTGVWRPVDIRKTSFPSITIYNERPTGWQELYRSDETDWTGLKWLRDAVARQRSILNQSGRDLPGCNILH